MEKRILYTLIFGSLLIALLSCSKSDDNDVRTAGPASPPIGTSLSFTLSSLKKLETSSTPADKQLNFTADLIFNGQLTAFNIDTSRTQSFDWTVYFDEETWTVQSNKTIILTPGNYEFSFLLTKGSQQYAGTTNQSVSNGTVNIPLLIRPIIGDTITDVSFVASLADFRFQFDPDELSTAGLSDPQMGIIVDGENESIFSINPATGISDNFINLTEGNHQIQLRFYDGALQRGRSIAEQESVIIVAGLDIALDLVALQGETAFTLTEEGGSATFNFVIPDEVIDEAGGTQNLETLFAIVGSRNPYQENVLTLTPSTSGDYEASITLTGIQVDLITISLTFNDISKSPRELLGSCNQVGTLDTTPRTLTCDLNLRRRAVISGSLLATLGVNVINELGEPVSGASVSENGNILGISGSGIFGSPGYIKLYLATGSYNIKAETALQSGLENVIIAPLGVYNLDISIQNRPSFSKVVYEKTVATGSEIYIMDADGLNQTRLTHTAENIDSQNVNLGPEYSMYLNRIIFSSNRDGNYDQSNIYSMELDGSGIIPLTADSLGHNFFCLSIDGLIYYSQWSNNMDLYLMNLDGSNKYLLPWSSVPDVLVWDISINNQIVFSQDDVLHRIDSFGSDDIVVGEKDSDMVYQGATWSPDGMKILVGRHSPSIHELWKMNSDGTNRVPIGLGELQIMAGQHRFSPDGAQIIFSAAQPGQTYDIYMSNLDGTGIINLTNTPDADEAQPYPF